MSIYEFASNNPWLTFFLAILIIALLEVIWKVPFRAISIWKHGWPPEHCDADGDLKKDDRE